MPALPEPGGDVLATSGGMEAGGSFNVMVAATRLGLPAAYAGAHGTGPFGDLVRAALRREGIDILLPPVTEIDTGYDIAITDAAGERTFITAVGAEARLSSDAAGRHPGRAGRLPAPVRVFAERTTRNAAAILELLRRVPAGMHRAVRSRPARDSAATRGPGRGCRPRRLVERQPA